MFFSRLLPFAVIFLLLQTLLRLSLLARAVLDVDFDAISIINVLMHGVWFDVITASFLLLPAALYHLLLPAGKHGGKMDRRLDGAFRFTFAYVMIFDMVAEHLFWSEFTARFNFIAVDYLVYTQEVIGNIVESYPLHWLLLAIGVCAAFIAWLSLRLRPLDCASAPLFKVRAKGFMGIMAACALFYTISSVDQSQVKGNAEASELGANGIYNLFAAFWNNEISYNRFYATRPDSEVTKNIRTLLSEEEAEFVHEEGTDVTRIIRGNGKEKHKNVIIVAMESMSADYMAAYGNKEGLTPNLDRLAKEGLEFTNLYATGTRTVRGLEALTLSIPPTPGQSIIRRPGNDNLFSLGFIFKDRGYDTDFIYGGYGYFDNMNSFFSGNGFSILDRSLMSADETHFANVWGICDEDMFNRSIKEADQSFASGKPFMHLIMTTSNHRPFTYPDGRIDIPSHSNRLGGVKYADYSIGKLIEDAKKKPWFKDTVFVFVADHTAGAGGKAELDPHKYHIPMIFYAPEFIKPAHYDQIASQIDMAPTLLDILNFSYYTKFYGEDVLHDTDETPHAFISNFQKVALVKEGELTVLAPKRQIEQYSWPEVALKEPFKPHIEDAIAYYQSASLWKERFARIPTVAAPK